MKSRLINQVRTEAGERGKVVPAIAVTTYATEKMRQRALCAGFDLWFTKPLHFDEFVAVLASLTVPTVPFKRTDCGSFSHAEPPTCLPNSGFRGCQSDI